jgi:hypothetical protein
MVKVCAFFVFCHKHFVHGIAANGRIAGIASSRGNVRSLPVPPGAASDFTPQVTKKRRMFLKYAYRSLFLLCMTGFCLLFASAITCAQTAESGPAFPKYKVMGVVYAPPGSASSVTYGNSNLVGSTDTMATTNSNTKVTTTSIHAESGSANFVVSIDYSTSDGWTTSSENSNSVSVQTTTGNSVATMGPISSSLGVDHDNDVIYIWLNPVLLGTASTSTSGTTSVINLNWTGLASNSCDPNNPVNSLDFNQTMNGCDPNQYPYPDIVGIPVWCLKNPYSPAQGCAQWRRYTSRSWDTSPWGTDPSTHLPLGPGLTMRDYADILRSDPFVVLNGNDVNVCHPNYGPGLDPNLPEAIAAPLTPIQVAALPHVGLNGAAGPRINYADPTDPNPFQLNPNLPNEGTGFWPVTCGTVGSNMNRFQPYGTVEYPVPGPNGLPSTYAGTFQYSQTQTNANVATDSHTVSQSVTIGAQGGNMVFNASVSVGTSKSTTWQQQSSTASTTGSTASAAYSITGPQLSDNYVGPATYNVYLDNVYGTYAFYSDVEPTVTPIEIGNIGISITPSPTTSNENPAAVVCAVASATPCINFTPSVPVQPSWPEGDYSNAVATVTLTNNSKDQITLAGPAVTFSDPGFQIVEDGSDTCSNQQLSRASGCTLTIEFAPVTSDAPNMIYGSTQVVYANIVAAGTVNVSATGSYQNSLITNYAIVSGTAQPDPSMFGATLLPTTQNNTPEPNIFIFPTIYSSYTEQETFTFTNYSNSSVSFPTTNDMILTDSADFIVQPGSDNCSGKTITALGTSTNTCTFTLQFNPSSVGSSMTGFTTKISANGTVCQVSPASCSTMTNLAVSGATGSTGPLFTVTPVSATTSNVTMPMYESEYSGWTGVWIYNWAVPITITNNSNYAVTINKNTATETLSTGAVCEQDAASSDGNSYFSPCTIYSENLGMPMLTAAQGYIFGQLNGYLVDDPTAGDPTISYNSSWDGSPATNGVPEQSRGMSCQYEYSYYFSNCLAGISPKYQTHLQTLGLYISSQQLTCTNPIPANSSCVAAVVAFLPYEQHPWGYPGNGATGTGQYATSFINDYNLPLSASIPLNGVLGISGNPAFTMQIPVEIDGQICDNDHCNANSTPLPQPSVRSIVISGTEHSSTQTVAATSATGTLTVSAVSAASSSRTAAAESRKRNTGESPSLRTPARLLPVSPTFTQSTLSVGVGGFTKAVNVPAGTTINDATATLAAQLNAAGSPVIAAANGSVITLTSRATGSGANLPLSAFVIGNYKVTPSGSALTGGKSGGTTTNYDSGTAQVTTNGVTASAPWGSTSTPESIATALAAAINQVAGAYWNATASGSVVNLTSVPSTSTSATTSSRSATSKAKASATARRAPEATRTASTAANTEATTSTTSNTIQVTVIDSAGFASPSFSATTN